MWWRRNEVSASTAFFRPDIQGLRAIAVLLVVAAHYAIPGISAGFIGVDIFFVISGYLITGILVREYQATGHIALLRFYVNRLRRLLPALATMLGVSALLIGWLLPVTQHPAQSQAGAMAGVWASNLFFAFVDVDYFAVNPNSNVFLHTWSLGVEEQFYLVWPLLILMMTPWTRGRLKRLAWLWLVVAALSLVTCLWLVRSQPVLAFYLMPTRAWQFAAGALAWLLAQQLRPSLTQANRVGWLGLTLLVLSLYTIDTTTLYPSAWALLPTAASMALLWAGSTTDHLPPVIKPLCSAPMQAVGRLSYAWYLWHWPVLVIGQQMLPIHGHWDNTLMALGLSLLAAILTHHLIENPIRFGRFAQLPYGWQMGLALCLMVLLNSQMLRWNTEAHDTLARSSSATAAIAAIDAPVIYQHGCDDWYHSDELKPCVYGKADAPKTALLLGDSIGAQWFSALTAMLDAHQWRIVVLTKSSCPIVDEPFFYQRIGRDYTECTTWRDRAIDWVRQNPAQSIFIGGTASPSFTAEQWEQGTRRILDQLAPHTDAIYVIEANPTLAFDGPSCLRQQASEQCKSAPASASRYPEVARYLQQAIAQQPKAHWLETSSYVCPHDQCQALRQINGRETVVFRDSQHLTASFVATAAEHFLRQMTKHPTVGTMSRQDNHAP